MQHRRIVRAGFRSTGFSLVEVLISILVLSVGLLGMVGMQATALQSNREARLQSVGYGLAQELAEMMRGNKDVGVLTSSSPYIGDFSTSPLAPATTSYCLNVSGTGCTALTQPDRLTLANAQMTEWLARVDDELPGARVRVCTDTAPYGTDGLPTWACTAPTGAGTVTQVFIKIGWTQRATNPAAAPASALVRTGNAESRPALVFPVIAGSTS